uniref:Uncharacterized protein n=1 Tax=Siphoviridae sp. ctrKX6 TaxID=2826476 RepID=A0A8S5NKR8_9CAUD|nr:MAG TPA: hypothetical protein [Siphoviridae sp. ctrKX6]
MEIQDIGINTEDKQLRLILKKMINYCLSICKNCFIKHFK